MPPKKDARDQLHLARTRLSPENLRSPLSRVPGILTWLVSVLQEGKVYVDSDHDDKANTADSEDGLSDGLGNNLSAPELPCNLRSQPCDRWRRNC